MECTMAYVRHVGMVMAICAEWTMHTRTPWKNRYLHVYQRDHDREPWEITLCAMHYTLGCVRIYSLMDHVTVHGPTISTRDDTMGVIVFMSSTMGVSLTQSVRLRTKPEGATHGSRDNTSFGL